MCAAEPVEEEGEVCHTLLVQRPRLASGCHLVYCGEVTGSSGGSAGVAAVVTVAEEQVASTSKSRERQSYLGVVMVAVVVVVDGEEYRSSTWQGAWVALPRGVQGPRTALTFIGQAGCYLLTQQVAWGGVGAGICGVVSFTVGICGVGK